jgi:glucose-6-phosphate-specific signal transduction histidine kinase
MAETTLDINRVNIPGVVAGALTLILPFLGAWWSLTLGTDAIVVNTSPFEAKIIIFGNYIASPLFEWFCLGLKLGVMYIGVLLIAGSILPAMNRNEDLARMFINFASRKLLWLVLIFVVALVIFVLLLNQTSSVLPVRIDIPFPYLVWTESLSADMENMGIVIPICAKFTYAFGVAVIASVSGAYSRIYHEKL